MSTLLLGEEDDDVIDQQVHADLALGKGPRAASAYAKSLPQVLCPSEDFKCISSQRYSGLELA